jgi:hypothetical protein
VREDRKEVGAGERSPDDRRPGHAERPGDPEAAQVGARCGAEVHGGPAGGRCEEGRRGRLVDRSRHERSHEGEGARTDDHEQGDGDDR